MGCNAAQTWACSSAAEHGAHNPRVAGSNPAGPTRSCRLAKRAGPFRPCSFVREWPVQLATRQGFELVAKSSNERVSAETQEVEPDGDPRALALHIADILTDSPAANTVLLEITEISSVADFFLICSGENERQLRAISEEISEELSEIGVRPIRTEGSPQSGWIVMDFGDVVTHIFDVELREYYKLEQLWAEAPRVLSIQ
jgi:ribosome-associated protein